MSQQKTSTSVQIRLTGEDADLYGRVLNKKAFLAAALRMFYQDEKLRLAFFYSESDVSVKKQPAISQQGKSDPSVDAEAQKATTEQPQTAAPRGMKKW